MPLRTSYEPGTPCWIDLSCPDQQAARRFYADLLGWQIEDAGTGSGYGIARLAGRTVAGFRHTLREAPRSFWTTYISVADVDATAKLATEAGARILMGPEDAHTDGRTADIADPGGAVFAIWQPRDVRGAELRDETGALSWAEYTTRDAEGAQRFYQSIFGWQAEAQPMGTDTYIVFKVGDEEVAGMMSMEDVPPHWMVYFTVEDCDASAAQVGELGGDLPVPPTDIPGIGRFAVCNDPQGAAFSIIT